MSLRLKPYPAYKDSGVPWLARLPIHWSAKRAKSVFTAIDVRSANGEEELLTVSSNDGVVPRREKSVTMFMAESYAGHKLCWPGDLVINSLWAWARGLGFARHHGIVSTAYGVYRPRPAYASSCDYLDYLIRSKAYDWELHVRSKGIWISRLQMTDESFFDMPIVLPPSGEAQQIARFLDHADRRINRLIRAKRRLIELLDEQKQAIINRAITCGLDPNVRLKPSGIDWLGDVPEGWEVRKLGHIARVFNGTTPSRMQPRYWDQGTEAWLASGKVNDQIVRTPTDLISEDAVRECSLSLVPNGALILGMVGQGKTRGMSARLGIDAYINQNLAAIVPRAGVDGQFLHSVLIAAYGSIREVGRGGNQEALNCEIVRSVRLPLPPLPEQVAIGQSIAESTTELYRAIAQPQREIDLLREYRTRLITDVVTGQLDVRGVALPPLDDDEPLDALDAADGDDAEALLEGAEGGDGDD